MDLAPLSPLELFVCVLAAYRGTRALVRDSITDTFRDGVEKWSTRGSMLRLRAAELVQCPFCTGFHLAWITYLVMVLALGRWHTVPIIVHVVWAWAVAGGQALLNRADDAVAD